jgi:glycosyltransferase involved in cell wall biosynthesis
MAEKEIKGVRLRERILFITQWEYNDALVQTYTLPYINIIKNLTSAYSSLVTIGRGNKKLSIKKRGRNIVMELPDPTGFFRLQWMFNIIILRKIIKKGKFNVLHAWCTPAGSVGVILKMICTKLKLVLDSVEPHAEAMVECKIWGRGLKFKGLFYLEKLQIKKADYLIFAAKGMDKYISGKYKLNISDYFVKPACIDLNMFSENLIKDTQLLKRLGLDDKIVCVYAGKFGGFYLEDETFEFIKQCEEYWGKDKFRFLLLSNTTDEYLESKRLKYAIDKQTTIKLFVPHNEVPKYMGMADFAISPYKPVPSKRYGTPIKNGEYWALGLPIVITPGISEDSEIIKENNAGVILQGFTHEDYIKSIKEIDTIISFGSRRDIYSMIRPLAEKYRNFSIAEKVYSLIYKA